MHTICYLPAYIYVLCVRTWLHICFMCSDMVILLSKVIPRSFPLLTSSINLFSILIFALLFLEIFDGSIIINWHLSSFNNIPLFLNHVSKMLMSDSSLVMILCIQMSLLTMNYHQHNYRHHFSRQIGINHLKTY